MKTDEYDAVARRLRTPAKRQTKSMAGFITEYLPEIAEARRSGKTWAMIGRDLCEEAPIKADTVRRTVERATKGATPNSRRGKKQNTTKRSPSWTGEPQLTLHMASPENPFGRRVDPIRNLK